ncbi:PAS domain-containing protein [Thalassobacillus sp. C254]|uniref:PAS domain-containing protein n=1 Tax=Thalassobacillus sp. C254 TaxID=1225341 RepID=UPI0006D27E0E|nr:PAS domain-containing protein [Thalassobacillus sp. C254]
MFQDLFNKIQIPLMITNSDGKIVFINDAGKKVAEDVTGSSLYQYLPAAYESIVKEYTFSPKAFMSKQAAEKVEIMVNGSLKTADMTVLDEQHLLFQWNHSLTTFENFLILKKR